MTKSQKNNEDKTVYLGAGAAFLGTGVVFFANENLRMVGMPLFVISIVFLAVGLSGFSAKDKRK